MNSIAVKKEVFEFTCTSESVAAQVQQKFAAYSADLISAIILKVVSENLEDGAVVSIDKIEVDLGEISLPDFGNCEMLDKFERTFKQVLLQVVNSGKYTDGDLVQTGIPGFALAKEWEVVTEFLINGDVPWWVNKGEAPGLDKILQQLIQKEPRRISDLLREQGHHVNFIRRLVAYCSPETLARVEELLPAGSAVSIRSSLFLAGRSHLTIHFLPLKSLLQLKSVFNRLDRTSPESIKSGLLNKLLQLQDARWLSVAALLNWLSYPDIETIQAFQPGQRNSKVKAMQALNRLSGFQVEVLLYLLLLHKDLLENYREPEENVIMDSGEFPDFLPGKNLPPASPLVSFPGSEKTNGGIVEGGKSQVVYGSGEGEKANWRYKSLINGIAVSPGPIPAQGLFVNGLFEGSAGIGLNAIVNKDINIPKENKAAQPQREENEETSPLNGVSRISKERAGNKGNSAPKDREEGKNIFHNENIVPYIKFSGNAGHHTSGNISSKPEKSNGRGQQVSPGASPGFMDVYGDSIIDFKSYRKDKILDKVRSFYSGNGGTSKGQSRSSVADKNALAEDISPIPAINRGGNPLVNIQVPGKYQPNQVSDRNPAGASGKTADAAVSFIMKHLGSADPVLLYWLKRLGHKEIKDLKGIFQEHLQRKLSIKKAIDSLLEHTFFLKYNLLQVLGSIVFDGGHTPPVSTTEGPVNNTGLDKKWSLLGKGVRQQMQLAQSAFLQVVDKLSLKETVILQDVLEKKEFSTRHEKSVIRKVLQKVPEPGIHILVFLTQLPEEELQQLLSPGKRLPGPGHLPSFPIPLSENFSQDEGRIYIENAGLCLVALYFTGLFGHLGYLENKGFKNMFSAARALYVSQYLVTGQAKAPEYLLHLNKLLCGFKMEDYVATSIRLTKKEKAEAEDLLTSVIENWAALKNTSVQGFRESFLQRQGILTEQESCWTLQVERRGYDLLLDTIPWGFAMIKLPWMKKMLQVEW